MTLVIIRLIREVRHHKKEAILSRDVRHAELDEIAKIRGLDTSSSTPGDTDCYSWPGIKECKIIGLNCKVTGKDRGYFEGSLVAYTNNGNDDIAVIRGEDMKLMGYIKGTHPLHGDNSQRIYNTILDLGNNIPCWGYIRKDKDDSGNADYFGNIAFPVNATEEMIRESRKIYINNRFEYYY